MPQTSGARRFKTLSSAIRDGCARYPLPRLDSHDPAGGRFGRSALHAAWVAEFEKDHPDGYVAADLEEWYPELRSDLGALCPADPHTSCAELPPRSSRSLEVAIIHLEDTHRWSRERVTRWLEDRGL
jgi:hypothetical protein